MNCTKCGMKLKKATCDHCGANHKNLLYKMADDAQTRREYDTAMEYYELIRKSSDSEEELNDISRVMAKLGFSLTDLTGNDLKKENMKNKALKILKTLFVMLIILSTFLIVYKIYAFIGR